MHYTMDNSRHPAGEENSFDTNAAFIFYTLRIKKNIKAFMSARIFNIQYNEMN